MEKNEENLDNDDENNEVSIPPQLRDESYRFVKIKHGTKDAIGDDWHNTDGANYTYDDPALEAWLHQQKSYGVLAFGDLVIIDADREEIVTKINKYLPPTFTVKSGGAPYKRHFYYKCKGASSDNTELTVKDEIAGHITIIDEDEQSSRYNIGPNCIHDETRRQYSIVNDIGISEIEYAQITEVLSPYLYRPDDDFEPTKPTPADTKFSAIKERLDLTDLLQCDGGDVLLCPFRVEEDEHNEPSFHISDDGEEYRCSVDSCKASDVGDIFRYYRLKHNCNGHEAARRLNEEYMLGINFDDYIMPSWGEDSERIILDKFMEAIRKPRANEARLLGEYENSLLTLFTFTSILVPCPLNLAVLGRSGEGKTEITQAVSQVLPWEWTHANGHTLSGSFTPKSLKYMGKPIMKTVEDEDGEEKEIISHFEIDLNKKIIMIMDDSGDQKEFVDNIKDLLSRDKEVTTNYVSPRGNSRRADTFIIKGWPCIAMLSTDTAREAEQNGRFLTISPSPPPKMHIMDDILRRDAIPDIDDDNIINQCARYMQTLKKVTVKIPFNLKPIIKSISSEQGIRHLKSMQTLIKSIAAFFQHSRPHLPHDDSVIFANVGDIELAYRLLFPSIQSSHNNIAPEVLDSIKDVKKHFGNKPFYCQRVVDFLSNEYDISTSTIYKSYWDSIKGCKLLRMLSDKEVSERGLDNSYNRSWYVIEKSKDEIKEENVSLDNISDIKIYEDLVSKYWQRYIDDVKDKDLLLMFREMYENYYDDDVEELVFSDYTNRWSRMDTNCNIDDENNNEEDNEEKKKSFIIDVRGIPNRTKDKGEKNNVKNKGEQNE